MRRWITAVSAYVGSTLVIGVACFVGAVAVAGPHSTVLPRWLQPVAVAGFWGVFLTVPPLIARGVWRRMAARAPTA